MLSNCNHSIWEAEKGGLLQDQRQQGQHNKYKEDKTKHQVCESNNKN